MDIVLIARKIIYLQQLQFCLLYTSDAADEL